MDEALYKPRPHAWPRFNLRILLLGIVALSLLLSSDFNRVRHRKAAQKELEASGAVVSLWDKDVDVMKYEPLRSGDGAARVRGIRWLMGDRNVLRIDFPRELTAADQKATAYFPEADLNYVPRTGKTADSRTISVGAWSEPVAGLRGRLHYARGGSFYGTQLPAIYLELQNVSERMAVMQIYYDDFSAYEWQLTDRAGKPIPGGGGPIDYLSPGSYWLGIPNSASLKLPATVNAYGVPRLGGTMIGLLHRCWIFPPDTDADYFLSCVFHPVVPKGKSPPRGDTEPDVWQHTLELPKLKIPIRPRSEKN